MKNPGRTGKTSEQQRPNIDQQILALDPYESKMDEAVVKRAKEILQTVDFLEVKKTGSAATAFYVWVKKLFYSILEQFLYTVGTILVHF